MLQRFRQNQDLQAVDSSKLTKTADLYAEVEEDDENFNKNNKGCANVEIKWWMEQDAVTAKKSVLAKKEQATKKVEQERYVKALRALVSEKGDSGDSEWKNEFFNHMELQMQCSNSQYYRNSKGYEKALRDILHCIN